MAPQMLYFPSLAQFELELLDLGPSLRQETGLGFLHS